MNGAGVFAGVVRNTLSGERAQGVADTLAPLSESRHPVGSPVIEARPNRDAVPADRGDCLVSGAGWRKAAPCRALAAMARTVGPGPGYVDDWPDRMFDCARSAVAQTYS